MSPSSPFSPGIYGKLPIVGDFVSRRLPGSFIEPWDTWLQASLLASREALDDEWLELYLSAPLWRFVIQAGILTDSAFAGVLMPSVDSANRYFPLTVATGTTAEEGTFALAVNADDWFVAAETFALSCLDQDASLTELEADLDDLLPISASNSTSRPLTFPDQGNGLRVAAALDFEPPDGLAQAFPHLLDALSSSAYGPISLWWTVGSEDVEPALLVFSGMPPAGAFVRFLTGSASDLSHPAEGD